MQHQIYFCDIQMKHNQHTYKTHKIYGCKVCSSTCCHPIEASWCSAEEHSVRHEQGTRGARRGWREARAGSSATVRGARCTGVRREAHGRAGCTLYEVGPVQPCETWGVGAHGRRRRGARCEVSLIGALPNRSMWHNFLFFSLTLPYAAAERAAASFDFTGC
jgi:hypothetical protein